RRGRAGQGGRAGADVRPLPGDEGRGARPLVRRPGAPRPRRVGVGRPPHRDGADGPAALTGRAGPGSIKGKRGRPDDLARQPGVCGGAMKRVQLALLSLLLLAGCGRQAGKPSGALDGLQAEKGVSFSEARRAFTTKLTRQVRAGEPVPEPPPGLFRTVRYDSPAGKLAAYLSPAPADGQKRPAIIWITGGDCNTI